MHCRDLQALHGMWAGAHLDRLHDAKGLPRGHLAAHLGQLHVHDISKLRLAEPQARQ